MKLRMAQFVIEECRKGDTRDLLAMATGFGKITARLRQDSGPASACVAQVAYKLQAWLQAAA